MSIMYWSIILMLMKVYVITRL